MKNPSSCFVVGIYVIAFSAVPSLSNNKIDFIDSCVVSDTIIKLSNIARFQMSGSDSDLKKLGEMPVGESAPAGYSRYVNSNDFIAFALRSRFPALAQANPQNKRILVKTAFQEKTIAEFSDSIEKYISGNVGWPKQSYSVVIANKNDTWKSLPGPIEISVEGLNSKFPKGNFYLKLIGKQGTRCYKIPVSCFMKVAVPIVVAKIDIARGSCLNSANCEIENRDITHCNFLPLRSLQDVENTRSSRAISAGSMLHEKLLNKIPLIDRDDNVMVSVTCGSVKIYMAGRAREAGSRGDKIWVENEMTHKLLKTRVVEHGKVILLSGEAIL